MSKTSDADAGDVHIDEPRQRVMKAVAKVL